MSVFVIADLHLAESTDKPMDIFGERWQNHVDRLRENWLKTVGEDDTVIIPGDVSWGMKASESAADFLFLSQLPGKKIILKGNHDYWWQTQTKLNNMMTELGITNISFLQNNAYFCEDFIICGSRGWFPENNYTPADEKIVNREAERLRLSFNEGLRIKNENPAAANAEMICFLHYPPAYGNLACDKICQVLDEYDIRRCYYGHMHNVNTSRLRPYVGKAVLTLIAADYLDFTPKRILPEE